MIKAISDTKEMLGDRVFLRKAVLIALPVALQGMLNTVVNLVDTMMIGQLGETAIAAVGLANKVFFVFTLLVFGVVSGSGVLAAQYWGNKDVKNIRKVTGLALLIAFIGALCFAIPSVLFPSAVMRIFTDSESAVLSGAAYLAVAALSYPFTAVTNTYVAMLRAVGQVKAPVMVSCMTILVNITLNYVLIFGHFGAPAMGVVGAAIATLAARVLECLVVLAITYGSRSPIAGRFRELFGYSSAFIRQFLATASPVIANEFMWGLGTTMYSLAYGRMGDNAVAAITIATTIQDIVVVLFQGLSAATAVILGNEMGAGKLKRAEKYAKNFFLLQFLVTVAGMAFCYAIRGNVISLYSISPQVARDVNLCLIVFILYMPFKMFNYVNIVGVLRSGGDTKVCLFIDTSGVWAIGVPMAFWGGLYLKQAIYVVYAMVMAEEAYKAVIGYVRYRQKKWLRNLAVELEGN
ncbi:MAG: MATE family efflux transporter [Lachnospiraceae bacterium]|nr:MATE family efflux transporter [Lachnospiraceae bacterium]MCI9185363.1 MATE family efflux transporter [Lachnospiraceae bacterium]